MLFVRGIIGCGLIGLYYIVLISRNQLRQGSKSGVFFPQTDNHGVGDIIPRGAPLRTEHSKKNTTVHGIGCVSI